MIGTRVRVFEIALPVGKTLRIFLIGRMPPHGDGRLNVRARVTRRRKSLRVPPGPVREREKISPQLTQRISLPLSEKALFHYALFYLLFTLHFPRAARSYPPVSSSSSPPYLGRFLYFPEPFHFVPRKGERLRTVSSHSGITRSARHLLVLITGDRVACRLGKKKVLTITFFILFFL